MEIPIVSIILSLTLALSSVRINPSLSELCNPSDKKVLLQIKKAFNDPYVLTSWKPDTDCCTQWYCVTCSPDNRIDTLAVITGTLGVGPIPSQIGDLPYLESIIIRKQANLTGPIPRALTKLKRLKDLRLTWNNLTGPVPAFLSELKALDFLDLSFNNLSGPIPSSLSTLPVLGSLWLGRNRLTGPIPASFGEFRGENFFLILSHNQLSGKLPASMGNKDFACVDLSRNRLEGDASVLFGANKTAQVVDLSRNVLEFDLSEVEFSKSLVSLDLNHNRIFGSLPVGLTALAYLSGFNVSYNRLCGKIPVGGNLQSFDTTSFFHNRCLCGSPLESCK